MKNVKGKLLKKLKSIKPVGYLMPDQVLQVFAIDGFIDSYPKSPNPNEQPKLFSKESELEKIKESSVEDHPEIIDVAELMKDLQAENDDDEELDLSDKVDDKENIRPTMKPNIDVVVEKENVNVAMKSETGNCWQNCAPLSEMDVSSFRKSDLNSCTLFDPNLPAAFEQAVKEHMKMSEEEIRQRMEQENVHEKKARLIEEES